MIPLRDDIPSERFPLVTVGLIVANVLIYIYQLSLGPLEELFLWKFGAVPLTIVSFQPVHPAATLFPYLTLVTAQFLHGNIWHLGGNMLFLWIFGDNVEDRLGHLRFLLFYIACGIISILAQVAAAPHSPVLIIGASGAIAGVMGGYMISFPHARILTLVIMFVFVRVILVPAVIFLGFWFIFQLLVGAPTIGMAGGGVAYFAHIGGFVAGMLLIKLLARDW